MSTTLQFERAEKLRDDAAESRKWEHAWWIGASCGVLMLVAVGMRMWDLGRVPGINGDEAEYGVRAMRFLRGEPIVWHTPTKNPVNPFYFGPLVLLHSIGQPSFTLLRVTAVASGVLALVLNFWFSRRAFDLPMAVASTTLLAVLPINIAYSRFGWDTCQTLAASLLVIYPVLLAVREPERQGRWIGMGVVGLLVAFLVHPTNIFLGAFLAAVVIVLRKDDWQKLVACRRAVVNVVLIGVLLMGVAYWVARDVIGLVPADRVLPVELLEFARNYVRLFSGTTIYRYISGAMLPGEGGGWDVGWYDAGAWLVMGGLAAAFVGRLRSGADEVDQELAWGWGLSLSGFFVGAGVHALEPHWERYGMCLVAPGALVMARGWMAWWDRGGVLRNWALAGGLLCGVGLLGQFDWYYFRHFARTGGESQATFRTGPIEPKLAAWQIVQRGRDPEQVTWVVVPQWWNYWPLAYLWSHDPMVRVVRWEEARDDIEVTSAASEGVCGLWNSAIANGGGRGDPGTPGWVAMAGRPWCATSRGGRCCWSWVARKRMTRLYMPKVHDRQVRKIATIGTLGKKSESLIL